MAKLKTARKESGETRKREPLDTFKALVKNNKGRLSDSWINERVAEKAKTREEKAEAPHAGGLDNGQKVGKAIGTVGAFAAVASVAGWLASALTPEVAAATFAVGAVFAYIGLGIGLIDRGMKEGERDRKRTQELASLKEHISGKQA